jgi:phospholipid transport system substrate-binding protein
MFALLAAFTIAAALGACTPVTQVWNDVVHTVLPADDDAAPTQEQIAALPDLNDFVTAAGETDRHPAAARIAALGEEVLAALNDPLAGETERDAVLCKVLARDVDIPLIARFALGRYWNKTNAEQREEYLTLFKAFLIRTYAVRLGGINIDDFEVLDAQAVGDADILVHSRVDTGERHPVRADWRVRERDGRYLILDLSVEGISMAVILRQEFGSILRKKGVEGLLTMLRDRTTAAGS